MIPIQLQLLIDHLWQSTVFALVAGALTLALRDNRAWVRYCLWFAASLKFLIPFSLLAATGSYFGRHSIITVVPSRLPIIADRLTESLVVTPSAVLTTPPSGSFSANLILMAFGLVWTIGFILLVCSWCVRWLRVRAVLKTASPVQLPINLKAISSPAVMEPGVFGIYDPILLLPEGITEKLTPLEFEAILLHEMSHVRRRDNLGTAIHMLVESIFWFHPLVWFLGTRLLDERERACDEDVLRAGNQPDAYAEGVLKVCELYLQSPLRCMCGVTGSNLKARIQTIMAGHIGCDLSLSKRTVLTTAGILALAIPIAIGIIHAAPLQTAAGQKPAFEAASIKQNRSNGPSSLLYSSGRLTATNFPLRIFIRNAFRLQPAQLIGGPDWLDDEHYDIIANSAVRMTADTMRQMEQSLLADRFKLVTHTESRDLPVYTLVLARSDGKLGSHMSLTHNDCDVARPAAPAPTNSRPICDWTQFRADLNAPDRYISGGITMTTFAEALSLSLDRKVIDGTGLTGRYDFDLSFKPDLMSSAPLQLPPGVAPLPPNPDLESLYVALQEQLGLKLESRHGPVEVLIIDSVQRPSEN